MWIQGFKAHATHEVIYIPKKNVHKMESFDIKTREKNFFSALKPLIPKAIEIAHICFENVLLKSGRIKKGEYDKKLGLQGLYVEDLKISDERYGFSLMGHAFSSTPYVEELVHRIDDIEKLLNNLHVYSPEPFPDEKLHANINISHMSFTPGAFTIQISARRYYNGEYGGNIMVIYDTFIKNVNDIIKNLDNQKMVRNDTFFLLYKDIEEANNNVQKKTSLENFIKSVFNSIEGFEVKYQDKRGIDSEVDLFIINESIEVFYELLGTPIIIECKHWNRPIPAGEIREFGGVLRDKRVKTGILVTMEGITGTVKRDAKAAIRTLSTRDGLTILVLEKEDLKLIVNGVSIRDVLRNKYYGNRVL